jgi:hypothetical protein
VCYVLVVYSFASQCIDIALLLCLSNGEHKTEKVKLIVSSLL